MATKHETPFHQIVRLANPTVGTEFILTAPGQGIWRVISVTFQLVTSAVVANRRVGLIADDSTDTWFATVAAADQTATQTSTYCAFTGAAAGSATPGIARFPLPIDGLILWPGNRLRSSTTALDIGDQYQSIRAQVEELPMGPTFEWLPSTATQVAVLE
jgi:hypothetical protein